MLLLCVKHDEIDTFAPKLSFYIRKFFLQKKIRATALQRRCLILAQLSGL